MSTSKKESIKNSLKRIISQKDAVKFIKKSKLQNKIFLNNEDISKAITVGDNEISINLKTKTKQIKIRCENFNEIITFVIDGESKKLVIPNKNEAIENKDFLYPANELFVKCKNKDEELFFKVISINKIFVKFEVLSDNENFIYNNIGNDLNSFIGKDINSLGSNEIKIIPSIDKVLKNKIIVIATISTKEDAVNKYLNDLIEPIYEEGKKNHFIDLLKMFEKETFKL
jgi:hypothetical protein